MDREKRKRLEAAGWTFASPEEFLGLSEEEAIAIEMKLASDGHTHESNDSTEKQNSGSPNMTETELFT